MTNTIDPPDPNQAWIDPETGMPTRYFFSLMEELLAGTSTNSIGTVLSGQNTTQAQVDGLNAAAQEEASEDVTADFVISADVTTVSKSGSAGALTTDQVTITVADGVAPYSISWSRAGRVSIDFVTSPSALANDGAFSASFTKAISSGEFVTSYQKVTVSDSTPGTPQTAELVITATFLDLSFDGSGIGSA